MERKTILIVEDEPTIVEALSSIVQKDGYGVVSAYDGESGWSEYKTAKPDLVLTDLSMPGMSGFDLLRRIRREDPKTPVIVVTAYATIEAATEAMRLGANDFLEKPFFNDELSRRIEECISKRVPDREITRLKAGW